MPTKQRNKTEKIFCEKNRVHIAAKWCAERYKVASGLKRQVSIFGAHRIPFDIGCQKCEQGKLVMEGKYMGGVKESTKVCPDCGEHKPLDAFYKDRSTADGRRRICKECDKKQVKERAKKRKAANQDTSLVRKIDFSPRPELLEKIQAKAEENLRTFSNQVIWMLLKGEWLE